MQFQVANLIDKQNISSEGDLCKMQSLTKFHSISHSVVINQYNITGLSFLSYGLIIKIYVISNNLYKKEVYVCLQQNN